MAQLRVRGESRRRESGRGWQGPGYLGPRRPGARSVNPKAFKWDMAQFYSHVKSAVFDIFHLMAHIH